MQDLDTLSPDAKVWIYQADRPLESEELEKIRSLGKDFVADWAAHGKELDARFEIFYDRFLIFFVDEKEQAASGCSIDRSVHFIKGLETSFDLDLMDRMQVAYRGGNGIDTVPVQELDRALQEGLLDRDSTVFNNLVRTKREFDAEWEIPLRSSWHARMIKGEADPAGAGEG